MMYFHFFVEITVCLCLSVAGVYLRCDPH